MCLREELELRYSKVQREVASFGCTGVVRDKVMRTEEQHHENWGVVRMEKVSSTHYD